MAQISDPVPSAFAVAPSDTVDLPAVTTGIYVGVSGDVTANMENSGTNILFKAMPVGWHPVRLRRILATGTTATNIIAVWQ